MCHYPLPQKCQIPADVLKLAASVSPKCPIVATQKIKTTKKFSNKYHLLTFVLKPGEGKIRKTFLTTLIFIIGSYTMTSLFRLFFFLQLLYLYHQL